MSHEIPPALEDRWRSAVESPGDGVWEWDVELGKIFFSERCRSLLGYAAEAHASSVTELPSYIYPDDLTSTLEAMEGCLEGRCPEYHRVHRLRCKDGSYCWVLSRGRVVEQRPDGRPQRIVGTHTRIDLRPGPCAQPNVWTQGLQVVRQILALPRTPAGGNLRFGAILDLLLQAFVCEAGSIYLVSANSTHATLLSASCLREPFVEAAPVLAITQAPYSTVFRDCRILTVAGTLPCVPTTDSMRAVHFVPILNAGVPTGVIHLASTQHVPLGSIEQEILLTIGQALGATLRELSTERSLADLHESLEAFYNSTDDLLFVIDGRGCILDVNTPAARRTGRSREDFIGLRFAELHPPSHRTEATRVLARALDGQTTYCALPLLSSDGDLIEVESRVVRGSWKGKPILLSISRDVGEQRRLERILLEKNDELQSVLDAFPDFLFRLDQNDRILDYHAGHYVDTHTVPSLPVGKTLTEVMPPDVVAPIGRSLLLARSTHTMQTAEYALQVAGVTQHFEARTIPVANDKLLSLVRNITARKQAELWLVQSRAKQQAILDNLPFLAWLKDADGRFEAVNAPFAKSCGHPLNEILGHTDSDVWPKELAEKYRTDDIEVMRAGVRCDMEEKIVGSDGEAWFETSKAPIFNERGEVIGTTGIARDITERKQLEEEVTTSNRELFLLNQRLAERAVTDGLTHLYNHTHMLELLAQEIARARRYEVPLSVLMLDLDNFKLMNDAYGHQRGDQILAAVGAFLKDRVRGVDFAGRYGGEEFLIVAGHTTEDQARAVAERIREGIGELCFPPDDCHITVSIGVAGWKDETSSALVARADARLYRAKHLGRNRVVSSDE